MPTLTFMASGTIDISPVAARLTMSMRDVGYDFVSAIADVVDNSIEAGARHVAIDLEYRERDSYVRIADDGHGMSPTAINEALRFGSDSSYGENSLGKYGLGLKTASLSQCRTLVVLSRAARQRRRIYGRVLDLDHIGRTNTWTALSIKHDVFMPSIVGDLDRAPGTVVLWMNLDRVFDGLKGFGGHARRRFERLAESVSAHLGMVFHRFIDGEVPESDAVKITVNGEIVQSWDPFARSEELTVVLQPKRFVVVPGRAPVTFTPYLLPHREGFSTPKAFERAGGPNRWNRQQGLYIYRANRLIQAGGWAGLRAIDEHTKLARAAIDFQTDLDDLFQVNVAKMRVSLPAPLKTPLERAVGELISAAQARYRRGEVVARDSNDRSRDVSPADLSEIGVAIRAAAISAGESDAQLRIEAKLRKLAPEVAAAVGWA